MGYVAAGYLTVLGGIAAYAAWLVRRSRQLTIEGLGGARRPAPRPGTGREAA